MTRIRAKARQLRTRLLFTLAHLAATPLLSPKMRCRVWSWAGASITPDTIVSMDCRVLSPKMLTTGKWCYIGPGCYFEAHGGVTLGDQVALGPHTKILTASHRIGAPDLRNGEWFCEPITIGSGTWVGGGTVVLPGVSIASGCVIAAGSVVTTSTEPNGLYAGTPAKRVRDLPADVG